MLGSVRSPSAWRWRRLARVCVGVAAACLVASTVPAGAGAAVVPAAAPAASTATPYSTAMNYTIRFYPRFITYVQQNLSESNYLQGPDGMGPLYGAVVAINDDTIYGSFFLNLLDGPQIFTIPRTDVTYSLLVLDPFGTVVPTTIANQTPGTYALVPSGWQGTLPRQVTKVVEVPLPFTIWNIRADKYSAGKNMIQQATDFRDSLRIASVPAYEKDSSTGATHVFPVIHYYPRSKAIADQAVLSYTTAFFRITQAALRSPTTVLTASDRQLAQAFNRDLAAANTAGRHGNPRPLNRMIQAARAAHAAIIARWLTHTDANRWIHFDNAGQWGTAYLDRAAFNEFIQFGNNAEAAGYYDAFTDARGGPLNGATHTYRLTFSSAEIPQAKRFWSLTAYIPPGITLVPNPARKYLVASYTPHLRTSRTGSITIYIQPTPPANPALRANWLPIPRGSFSLLLRVYGPTGNTAPGTTYIPPKLIADPES
jgi:hypothetical protein